ncbi:hypothetical protein [Salinimicrobium xinjiangense]|uniref:hypothetical protein n=1 Tax=Salinimicrobium xinjiangense TaxID=438596 RepID=UPI0003FA9832|nr:hypothetical protein [Salinimicrobium xinjiangense]
MKKYILFLLLSFSLSTALISCRETQTAAEATGEAVEEGVDETRENTGLGGQDDL